MPSDWNIKMPDIKSLSIHDLWCLSDLFGALRETTCDMCNAPRFDDTKAGDFTDKLWGEHFAGICQDLYEEVRTRKPVDRTEAEKRAWAIIRYLDGTDDFKGMMIAAVDALEAPWKPVAEFEQGARS